MNKHVCFLIVAMFCGACCWAQHKPARFQIEYYTEFQSNFNNHRNNWVNLLMLGADVNTSTLGLDHGQLNIHTNTFHKINDSFVSDNWQGVSAIEERTMALGLSMLGYTHAYGKMLVFGGLRSMFFDYFKVPYNDLFAGASPRLFPTLWSNMPLPEMPLSAMGVHFGYQASEQLRLQNSIYNGVSYDIRKHGFFSAFTVAPANDGITNLTELDYKSSRGEYQLGLILRPWGRTIAQDMGYNHHSSKYVEHQLRGGAWALWALMQHTLYETENRNMGVLLQGSIAPFRGTNCSAFYGVGACFTGVFNVNNQDQLGIYFNTAHFSTLTEHIVELTWVYPLGQFIYLHPAYQFINSGGENANVGLLRLGFHWE